MLNVLFNVNRFTPRGVSLFDNVALSDSLTPRSWDPFDVARYRHQSRAKVSAQRILDALTFSIPHGRRYPMDTSTLMDTSNRGKLSTVPPGHLAGAPFLMLGSFGKPS